MAIYRDTGVFYLSITGTDNFQYRPLLTYIHIHTHIAILKLSGTKTVNEF